MKARLTALHARFTAVLVGWLERSPRLHRTWQVVSLSVKEWVDDGASRLAAALAYYTIFSLAPLLLIAIAVAGLFFGEAEARSALIEQMAGLLGDSGARYVQVLLEQAWQPSSSVLATVIGLGTLLVGATGAFAQLQEALNLIWNVEGRRGGGLWVLLRRRLVSFSMVLTIGFLLLVSLVLSAVLAGIGRYVSWGGTAWVPLLNLLNALAAFGVTTLLFAAIYKILPDAQVRWRNVWLGAATASLLFSLGRFLLGFYLGRTSFASVYGAAGSFVLILFWVYISAQILFFGAEVTQASTRFDPKAPSSPSPSPAPPSGMSPSSGARAFAEPSADSERL